MTQAVVVIKRAFKERKRKVVVVVMGREGSEVKGQKDDAPVGRGSA